MINDFWVRYQRWSVFWYSKKKKKYVRKRFREDLGAALKFYTDNLSRPGITLHVDNHGYPPPRHITEHEVVKYEVVSRRGKKYKRTVRTTVNLMGKYNRKGVWWCSYCIKLRRFTVTELEDGSMEAYCPVCTASHRLVKEHNPGALTIEMRKQRRRSTSGRRQRRKRG